MTARRRSAGVNRRRGGPSTGKLVPSLTSSITTQADSRFIRPSRRGRFPIEPAWRKRSGSIFPTFGPSVAHPRCAGTQAPAQPPGQKCWHLRRCILPPYRSARSGAHPSVPSGCLVHRSPAGTGFPRDAAEVEADRAADLFESGAPIQVQARPAVAPLFYTDEEEPESEEFLAERPPLFVGQEVGTWGSSWPASLIARERLEVSVPEAQRSHAIVEAIARREPIVILHEYGRLWLYRLEWEGLSGRYSRFTNAETIFHKGTHERGDYSVSNVQGRPEVEAFVTEDGGVLSPPGAGKLFSHTGEEFEDPLLSKVQNASAFVDGMVRGLEGADFQALADRLPRMAALNVVFPTPFAIGAVRGLVDEMLDLVQLLNPQQWAAIEAAARETILLLNDPDGEGLAATLGEEFGRNQAVALGGLLQQSLPIFAYEVGKLIGPTIIELLLALIGIEIGPAAMLQKSLAAMKQVPRITGMVGDLVRVLPDLPDEAPGTIRIPDRSMTPRASRAGQMTPGLPDLSREEQALLARTGNRMEFPDALPQDLADQELAIVKRSTKVPSVGAMANMSMKWIWAMVIGGKSRRMGPGAGSRTSRPIAPCWCRRQVRCHQERSWRRLRIEHRCWNATRHGPRIVARIKSRWLSSK